MSFLQKLQLQISAITTIYNKFILTKKNKNVSCFFIFQSKYHPFYLVALLLIFTFLKWPDLSLPIWQDEMSYLPINLWDIGWSFFLPWNYNSHLFMGHPPLHPFILYTVFSIFGPSVFAAKATSLFLSLFFLLTLYKMAEAVFQDSITAFYSFTFTMFLSIFWTHSSLILADISATAFGFGAIYAFTAKKYKTLLLFCLGMGLIRESSLAFFVPLLLYAVLAPSYRKSLFYIFPGFFVFGLHFFIFFLQTGHWITHPYISRTLPHNPSPKFFNVSQALDSIQYDFYSLILDTYPLGFLILAGVAIIGYFIMFYSVKRQIKASPRREVLVPLCMCILWFSFWVLYPDQLERNYFPILFFLIPLGVFFIIRVIPHIYSHIFLISICCFLIFQTAYIENHVRIKNTYLKKNILNSKFFISYFDKTYGNKIRNSKKAAFAHWPESLFLGYPEYEYVKTSITTDHDCKLNNADKKYMAFIFFHSEIWDTCIPLYKSIKSSNQFVKVEVPFEGYQVFLHKDFL